jgi:hypothetical protein
MRVEDLLEVKLEGEIFYNGYFVNKTDEDLQNWIGKQFSLSSDIKSLKRKRVIQMILEKFSKYFESLNEGKYSFQFFVGENYSKFIELDRGQLDIIKRYHNKDLFLMEECGYDWLDFYFNDKFLSVYEVNKEALQHYYFTNTKFEERDRVKVDNLRDYLIKFPGYFFVDNSNSKILEKMSPIVELESGRNKHEQLLNTKSELDLQRNIRKLEMIFIEMDRSGDKFVYGNEVIRAIENYEVKEIYCFAEFKKKLEDKMDKGLFNFIWYVYPRRLDINSIKRLDEYRGIFGIKYF